MFIKYLLLYSILFYNRNNLVYKLEIILTIMKKILLIEDSLTQLTSLKTFIAKAGYEVLTSSNGPEGISITYQTLPDLIVSDIFMPEINGFQLCRLLRNDNITKNIPIILITNRKEKISKFWGLRSGADAFLIKECDFENNLIKQIQKVLNKVPTISEDERKKLTKVQNTIPPDYIQTRIKHLLDQSLIESTIINEFRNLSEMVRNTKVLKSGFFSLISAILDYNVAGIFFNDRDSKKEKLLSISTSDVEINEIITHDIKAEFFEEIFNDAPDEEKGATGYETFEKTTLKINTINKLSDFQSKTIIPIKFANRVLGGLCLYHIGPNKYNSSKLLSIIVEELKILMRIKWLYSETKFLAITDGLTSLYNRRYFQQVLEREFSRAKRYKDDLSLVLIDIDHFKHVNDTYGHQFGDKTLAEISKIIKNGLRKTDFVARYGGEEIVAILPETSLKTIFVPIERLRKSIEEKKLRHEDRDVSITVSIGVACLTNDTKNEQDLIQRADQALYTAKENGRNRVEYYRPE